MEKEVYLKKEDNGIAYVVFNKPERKNAISYETVQALTSCMQEADADSNIRVIILKGEGHCFCAGGDLKGASSYPTTVEFIRYSIYEMCKGADSIIKCSKPVIAMLEGYAIGGGASLALACDFIIMSETAKLALNFLHLGLAPELGSLLTLGKTCGLHKAKDILFSGRRLTASEAYDVGLACKVCPQETIEEETLKYASMIASLPSVPVEITKRYMNSEFLSGLNELFASEAQNSTCCSLSKDCVDFRMKNFMKK